MVWNDDLDNAAPVVLSTDHPLSLGFRLKMATHSPHARKANRLSARRMAKHMDGSKAEGMHAVWNERKLIVISINFVDVSIGSKLRIIELVTHEVSHAVDGFFERAHLRKIDTELRAYYNDFIVGKVMNEFPAIVN